MSGNTLTLIFYYVPEDHDDIDVPNAFGIKKPMDDIRIIDIRDTFPLEGQYHFRFKYKYDSQYVWLDLSNPNCKLPTVDGRIVMKASRKSWKGQRLHNLPDEVQSSKKLIEGLDSPAAVPATGPAHVNPMSLNVSIENHSRIIMEEGSM
eukprot:TRINITY_DN521_c0_g1_i14.p2 TRINITY_DN521_c0_g1~~TRINITY_DN521_c0_g1_i14.p2  ORF type:complete len:149 (-),score=30.42 TRINITY_DN521_c0_g1_i14:201-647(-)